MRFVTQKTELEIKPGMRTSFEGGEYILARISNTKYCFVSLVDGNRWDDPYSLERIKEDFKLNNKECVIERGMRFHLTGDEYILARITPTTYSLILLHDGNRYYDPSSMENIAEQLNCVNATLISK